MDVKTLIDSIEEKKSKFYFFIPDTAGNIIGSLKYTLDIALAFKKLGYPVYVLHEKKEYKMPPFGDLYGGLEFLSFLDMNSNKKHMLSAADFLFIGESYVQDLVSQISKNKVQSKMVVISQNWDYIFTNLDIGMSWEFIGIKNVLTTSEWQKQYILEFMPGLEVDVVNPYVGDHFSPPQVPTKPFVAIVARNASDGDKFIKQFYLKYPLFSWVPFKSLGQLSNERFAEELSECCAAVWMDDISSFGTFPLEAMKCGVPTVALVPTLVPEYAVDGNGLAKNAQWCLNRLTMVDGLADIVDDYLHNKTPDSVFEVPYTKEKFDASAEAFAGKLVAQRVEELKTYL